MSAVSDKLLEEALSLPAEARLDLVERLIASLNLPIDKGIERAWAEEAERRVEQIESGEAELIPGDEVFSRIRKKLGQ